MNIYVFRNGKQEGPYSREQLKDLGLTPDTLVWYEGLSEWMPAQTADQVSWIFRPYEPAPLEPEEPARQPQHEQPRAEQQQCHYRQPAYAAEPQHQPEYDMPCPPSYLWLGIVCTVCCCMPLGVVSVIYAARVQALYYQGRYDEALSASRNARNWGIASAIVGVVCIIADISLMASMPALQGAGASALTL